MTANVLKHKGDISTGYAPSAFQKRIGLTVEGLACGGVFEFAKVVIVTMDDDRSVPDSTRPEADWGSATDRLGESESEETDASHQDEDDAEETHFLAPRTLLLRCSDA